MSLRLAVVLAALVVCVSAQTQTQYLNFGTYAENFEPAPGFVLTTLNDASNVLRGNRAGLLQTSTVIVVKVGAGVTNLREGQTVYPALQRFIDINGGFVATAAASVDTRAFCPQPFDINPITTQGGFTVGNNAPNGPIPNPISEVTNPLNNQGTTTTTTTTTSSTADAVIRGRYCIYHESQIAAVINSNSVRGTTGSSQVFNSDGFVSNIAGTTRPTL